MKPAVVVAAAAVLAVSVVLATADTGSEPAAAPGPSTEKAKPEPPVRHEPGPAFLSAHRSATIASNADVPPSDTTTPEPDPKPATDDSGGPNGDVDDSEAGIPDVWLALADCETGDRIDGQIVPDTRRWHVGATADHLEDESPPWSTGLYYGGLQFDRQDSWPWAVAIGGHDVPANPANATPQQQVAVAKTLLEIHPAGWGAWPACSRMLNLR